MHRVTVKSEHKQEFIEITSRINSLIEESGVREGVCVLYTPHTTAGLTINENADPDVVHDMLLGLGKIAPQEKAYKHWELNSPAHIKSSIMGCDQNILLHKGQAALGQWQGIYFCEFDGPREREIWVQIIANGKS